MYVYTYMFMYMYMYAFMSILIGRVISAPRGVNHIQPYLPAGLQAWLRTGVCGRSRCLRKGKHSHSVFLQEFEDVVSSTKTLLLAFESW